MFRADSLESGDIPGYQKLAIAMGFTVERIAKVNL